jgi:hypothetical protein
MTMSQDVAHDGGGRTLVDLTGGMAMAQDMASKMLGGDTSGQRMLAKYVTNG